MGRHAQAAHKMCVQELEGCMTQQQLRGHFVAAHRALHRALPAVLRRVLGLSLRGQVPIVHVAHNGDVCDVAHLHQVRALLLVCLLPAA
eukprot:SAG31_NODE_3298_length_4446_cov_24.869335_2_plen_89_part_00